MRFEPAGFTKNPEVPIAKSLVDYVFRWLGSKFLSPEDKVGVGIIARDSSSNEPAPLTAMTPVVRSGGDSGFKLTFETSTDAPACHECGSIMVRSAACYKCMNCGATSGCS
jgi:ribonucleoside-diphosphate reductase alpha chain